MVNSRQKGKRGELELCATLKEVMGWTARRSVQFCGDAGDSDLVVEEHPNLFVEGKRVQNLNLHAAMTLAVEQAKDKLPIVCHRKDRTEWLLTLRLADLPGLLALLSVRSKNCCESPTSTPPRSPAD